MKNITENYLANNTEIVFSYGVSSNEQYTLSGTIKGISTIKQPVVGAIYIVEITAYSKKILGYNYDCIVVPESSILSPTIEE